MSTTYAHIWECWVHYDREATCLWLSIQPTKWLTWTILCLPGGELKATSFPLLQAGYACQQSLLWKHSNLNTFVKGDLVDCSRQRYKLVVSSYNELGKALHFLQPTDPWLLYCKSPLLLVLLVEDLTLTLPCSGNSTSRTLQNILCKPSVMPSMFFNSLSLRDFMYIISRSKLHIHYMYSCY